MQMGYFLHTLQLLRSERDGSILKSLTGGADWLNAGSHTPAGYCLRLEL